MHTKSKRLKEYFNAYKIVCTKCDAVVKSRHGETSPCCCDTDIHWSTQTELRNVCPYLSEGGVFFKRKEI